MTCAPAAGAVLGAPGSLISATAIAPPPDSDARAWRIEYVSTDDDGRPIAVTGIVVAPRAPSAARPVVAWAHPTSGIRPQCAPSTRGPGFAWISGLNEMLHAGFVVTATDYPGLGTAGVHPYLVGRSEAQSVIDSVRAARHLTATHSGKRFTVWGHSQGGHAALWTALRAPAYAPDLTLVGVAASAPPTDLAAIVEHTVDAAPARAVAAYMFAAWSHVYDLPLSGVLKPPAARIVAHVAGVCAQTGLDAARIAVLSAPLRSPLLVQALRRDARWAALFTRNSPGVPTRRVPFFIAQGMRDALVAPAVTTHYVNALCIAGDRVEFDRLDAVGHNEAGMVSAPAAVRWMQARFSGARAPTTCPP